MTIQEMRTKRAALLAKAKQLNDSANTADRDLTADEQTEYDAAMSEAVTLKTRIDRADALRDASADIDAGAGRKTVPDAPRQDIKVGEPNLAKDPKKGYANPRAFLMDVMAAGRGQRREIKNPEAVKILAAAGSDEHGEYSDPHGGFLVPEAFAPGVLTTSADMDPIGSRTRKVPMTSPVVKFNARVDKNHSTSVSGGLTVSRKAETASATASRMQFEKVTVEAYSLWGFAYATNELLTDSPTSFASLIADGFSQEFPSHLIGERISGTGAGEMLGVLNSPALVTVSKESGQAADTIVYENILKMRQRVWNYQNAVWIANHDTYVQLALMNLSVGTGGVPVFMSSATSDMPDTLLGRPLILSEYASTVGDVGDIMCLNLNEYLEGVLTPLNSDSSIHVRFDAGETAFRFYQRIGGAPWWASAMTPKKGANTLSPFVTLAARA